MLNAAVICLLCCVRMQTIWLWWRKTLIYPWISLGTTVGVVQHSQTSGSLLTQCFREIGFCRVWLL